MVLFSNTQLLFLLCNPKLFGLGCYNEENEIVEPDVDVHLFGISMDVPFDNNGVTNLVPDDVLEGKDLDVINVDGFDSDPGNDDETGNYRRRRLVELSIEMEGVINASGQ
ncbi:hypothetical protein Tco_0915370 [Tanacetum coccineum]